VPIARSSVHSWRSVRSHSFREYVLTSQLLNQMDGFDSLGRTKLIMATNRPDTLDPALLRPGRLDRKIEIPLPNEQGRLEILKIHAKGINKSGDIDYEAVVKLSDGFNGADLRNVCTEAGMFAIRDDR
jgi:26S proteasome regulatory subunit T4